MWSKEWGRPLKKWQCSDGTMTELEFRVWCHIFAKDWKWVTYVLPLGFACRRITIYGGIATQRARQMLDEIRGAGYRHAADELEPNLEKAEESRKELCLTNV